MAERQLKNWIETYLKFTENTESATIFHKWVAISCIAAALQRKFWFRFGIYETFPNLYVVLVAHPGVARKTKAISLGRKVLEGVPGIRLGPNVLASPQALYIELENAMQETNVSPCNLAPNGFMKHCSLTMFSDEFEVYIGQKGDNAKMIAQLTDFYDCTKQFDYKAKQAASTAITNIWLSILAATTPASLATSFPTTAIGGGFSRRIAFIWAGDRSKKVAIPDGSDQETLDALRRDLYLISTLSGEVTFSPSGKDWWEKWYDTYDFDSQDRINTNPNFIGWYSVKPTFLQKIAMIVAASKRQPTDIKAEDFEDALTTIEEMEEGMEFAFQGVGRSEQSADIQQIETIIQKYKSISEEMLFQIIWRDIPQDRFDLAFNTIKKKGTVRREYKKLQNGSIKTYYTWN